jgi:hypothetical protein
MASRPRKPAAPRTRRVEEEHPINGQPAESVGVLTANGPTDDEIRITAYHKWVAAGCPAGDDMRFWFEAERELRAGTK